MKELQAPQPGIKTSLHSRNPRLFPPNLSRSYAAYCLCSKGAGTRAEQAQKRASPNILSDALGSIGPADGANSFYYLTSIFFGSLVSAFRRVSLRTPSLYEASTFSVATFSGIRKLLWKDP